MIDPHGFEYTYEVVEDEHVGRWYIVEKRTRGSVLATNILAQTYESEDEANAAVERFDTD